MARILIILENSEFVDDVLFLAKNNLKSGEENLYVGLTFPFLTHGIKNQGKAFGSENKEDANFDEHPLITDVELATGIIAQKFQNRFSERGLKSKLCTGECFDIQSLNRETNFADLLIISQANFYQYLVDQPTYSEFQAFMQSSKCPILVLPPHQQEIKEIFVLHQNDKLPPTIKSFASLFTSKIRKKEVSLLSFMPSDEEEIVNERSLVDYMSQHFSNIGLMVLHDGNLTERASDYVANSTNAIVLICGFDNECLRNLILPNLDTQSTNRSIAFFIGNSC
jgi:hypothetical protein